MKMRLSFYFCTAFFYTITFTNCAKILGVFPGPGYSQFILAEKLMSELAHRGHEVTVISAFKPKENIKNYRTILVESLAKRLGANEDDLFSEEQNSVLSNLKTFYEFGAALSELLLADKAVQEFIHSNASLDLVIVEQFVNEAHMGFALHFKAPLILFSSLGQSEWTSHLIGNARLPSVEPIVFNPYSNRMTFFQRLHNSIVNLINTIYKELVYFKIQQNLLSKYFPNNLNLEDILYNTSLLLLNSHATTTHPTSLVTAAVEIGGFHISPKKLPEDLQKFLDEADYGVIFFSMGSNLKSSNIPKIVLNDILKVFSKLKQRVLWKFEDTSIDNIPKNVLISKWLPQVDILGHPNVVAFITHSGLLSTTEATFYGVPMICIPIFGDQKMNMRRSVEKGIAVYLPFNNLSEISLNESLQEILENPRYLENARKYANIFRDQIVRPLDLATYWIEHIIRHGGAYLKNSSLELYWFQLYLLDVVAFMLFLFVLIYYLIKLLLRKIFRYNNISKIKTS